MDVVGRLPVGVSLLVVVQVRGDVRLVVDVDHWTPVQETPVVVVLYDVVVKNISLYIE